MRAPFVHARPSRGILGAAILLASTVACGEKPGASGTSASAGASATGASTTAQANKPRVKLAGVDTSVLTTREHQTWSELVTELLAPCKEVAVPIAQCVEEKRACGTCLPAAELLLRSVQAGLPREDVLSVFEARFHPDKVKAIVIGGSPSKGPSDAPVTVVEFADFECPACGAAYPLLEEVYAGLEGKVRFVFKHFPLSSHPNAKLAAQAAFAAQRQGQFWPMHKVLFNNQLRLAEPELVGYAEKAGLDVAKFKQDMHSAEAKERVEAELKQGEALGVAATPTVYVNGRECDLTKLADPERDLKWWIELELKLVQAGTQPAGSPTATPATSASAGAAAPTTGASAGAAPRAPRAPGR